MGALIVMTWLQFGGATVYVPAHARPPILARMLGLAGLGSKAMGIAGRSHDSALAHVDRTGPEVTDARSPSDARRHATSVFGSGPTLNAGYYVAHSDAEHSSEGAGCRRAVNEQLTAASGTLVAAGLQADGHG